MIYPDVLDIFANPSDILDAAASYMEEHGKAKELYENEDGAVCAEGAIFRVLLPNTDEADRGTNVGREGEAAGRLLRRWIEDESEWTPPDPEEDPEEYSIIEWSDANDAQTVVTGLRAAAQLGRTDP